MALPSDILEQQAGHPAFELLCVALGQTHRVQAARALCEYVTRHLPSIECALKGVGDELMARELRLRVLMWTDPETVTPTAKEG